MTYSRRRWFFDKHDFYKVNISINCGLPDQQLIEDYGGCNLRALVGEDPEFFDGPRVLSLAGEVAW